MVKTTHYKMDAIIYFKGDRLKKFYVIKKGLVIVAPFEEIGSLNKHNKERYTLGQGEFFGVSSTLAGRPSTEMAVVASNTAEVLELTISEFITVIDASSSLLLLFLKQYVSDFILITRKIMHTLSYSLSADETVLVGKHNANKAPSIDEIINEDKELNKTEPMSLEMADEKFYNTGLFFFKNRFYKQAEAIYELYLEDFPDGKHVSDIKIHLPHIKESVDSDNDASSNLLLRNNVEHMKDSTRTAFDEGRSFFLSHKYTEAVLKLGPIVAGADSYNDDYKKDSVYMFGDSLYRLGRYKESILYMENFIETYTDSGRVPKAFLLLIKLYRLMNSDDKAKSYSDKLEAIDDVNIASVKDEARYVLEADVESLIYKNESEREASEFGDLSEDNTDLGGLDALVIKDNNQE